MRRLYPALCVASALSSLFAYVSVRWAFPVCEFAGVPMPMRCSVTAAWVAALAVLAVAAGAFAVVSATDRGRLGSAIVLALFGVALVAVPFTVAPVCGSPAMPCRTGSLPAIVVTGSLAAVLALAAAFVARDSRS